MCTVVGSLPRKLGGCAVNPTYIFTERRGGYRMAEGAQWGLEESPTGRELQ